MKYAQVCARDVDSLVFTLPDEECARVRAVPARARGHVSAVVHAAVHDARARISVRVDLLHRLLGRRGRGCHGRRWRRGRGRPDLVRVPRCARVRLYGFVVTGQVEVEALRPARDGKPLIGRVVPVLRSNTRVARVHLAGAVIVRIRACVEAATWWRVSVRGDDREKEEIQGGAGELDGEVVSRVRVRPVKMSRGVRAVEERRLRIVRGFADTQTLFSHFSVS
jgi:hypothetical protein